MALTFSRVYVPAYEFFPGLTREPVTVGTYENTTGGVYAVTVGKTRASIRAREYVKPDKSGLAWPLTSWQAMDSTARAAVRTLYGDAATLTLDRDTTRRAGYVRHTGRAVWERHYLITRPNPEG
jgi:hypothetical protein